jgi:hypothetical protein
LERGTLRTQSTGHGGQEADLLREEVRGGGDRGQHSRADARNFTRRKARVTDELGRTVERGGELFDEVAARSESKDG